MRENSMVVGATAEYERQNPELTPERLAALREAALEDVSKPQWWEEPKALSTQLAAIAEAVQTGADDAKLARMARYMVEVACDWQVENT